MLKSLLSIKPPAGNENHFQHKKLQKYIAQRFEENQAVLQTKFILTQPLQNEANVILADG